MGILIINHCKDLYEPTSIMESRRVFSWLMKVVQMNFTFQTGDFQVNQPLIFQGVLPGSSTFQKTREKYDGTWKTIL